MTNELAIRIITGDVLGTSEQTHEAIKMAVKALSQPERKKGKWVDLKCDQCGQVDTTKPNFCPNCGADMRGEQDD